MKYSILLVVFYLLAGCADHRRDALAQVKAIANQADSSISADGGYKPIICIDVDPWGTPIRLSYESMDQGTQYLFVRSAGPDREFETADDLRARRGNLMPENAGRGVRQFLRGVVIKPESNDSETDDD